MIRASLPCLWLALAVAIPSFADFPLEEYVPADFHRRYLSVSPTLDWRRFDGELHGVPGGREHGSAHRHNGLLVNYGSVRQGQALRWDLNAGGGAFLRGNRYESAESYPDVLAGAVSYDHEEEASGFGYHGFGRLSGQWFFAPYAFLMPSARADFGHSPMDDRRTSGWRLASAPGTDSVRFEAFGNEAEAGSWSADVTVGVAAGLGKLQEVTFAETGMFLLDRIAEVTGRRVRLAKEGMRDLEAFVEARRKQRGFADFRRAAIHDLESVAIFLRRSGLDSLPPRAVLEMADEWRHARRLRRKSGLEARLQPFARFYWESRESEETGYQQARMVPPDSAADPAALRRSASGGPGRLDLATYRYRGETDVGVGLEAAWRRPWRRFWQFDMDAWIRGALETREAGDHVRQDTGGVRGSKTIHYLTFAYPRLEYGASFTTHWLPTSRTLIRAGLGSRLDHKFDYLDPSEAAVAVGSDPEQEVLLWITDLRVGAEYHLSDRLTARADLRADRVWQDARDEARAYVPIRGLPEARRFTNESQDLSLSAGLTYYVF